MLQLLLVILILSTADSDIMGPFEIYLNSTELCTSGRPVYRVPYTSEVYEEGGRSMFRWNLTIPRRTQTIRGRVTIHMLQNGTYKKVYDNDDVLCKQVILRTFLLSGNYDPDIPDCVFNKGVYHGDRIDVNRLTHLLSNSMVYGDYKTRSQWYVPRGEYICQDWFYRVMPVVKKPAKHSNRSLSERQGRSLEPITGFFKND